MIYRRLEDHIFPRVTPDGFFVRFLKEFLLLTEAVVLKKGVLKNFAKFTGKHLYGSLFYNKVAACKPATLSKKRIR